MQGRRRNNEFETGNDRQKVPDRPNNDEIARRAYERYEARGREDGHSLDDWLSAERDLSAAQILP